MNIKKVCKNVGYDGKRYACMRCGKTFDKETQVIGHLGHCPGRAISLGILPATTSNELPDNATTTATTTTQGMSVIPLLRDYLLPITPPIGDYWGYDNRLNKLENEYNHLLVQNNTTNDWFSAWLSANKGVVILAGILFIIYMIYRESACKCDTEYPTRARGRSGIGSAVFNKVVGKGVDYGLSKLLK